MEESGVVKAYSVGNTLCVERKNLKAPRFKGISGAFFKDDTKNDYVVTGYEYQQLLEYWQESRINQTTKNPPIRFNRDLIIYEEVNQNPPPKANQRLPPATKTKKTS